MRFSKVRGIVSHRHNWVRGVAKSRQEVSYPELEGNVFLNDSAMFLVGMAIVLDAFVRVVAFKRMKFAKPLAYLGLLVTVLATVYNVYAAGVLLKGNVFAFVVLVGVAMGATSRFSSGR